MVKLENCLDSTHVADVLSTSGNHKTLKFSPSDKRAVAEIGRQGRLRICW